MPSISEDDYLKTIYHLGLEGNPVGTMPVAEALGVSAASATNMIKKLAGLGLAEHSPYHGVTLTPAGERRALEVIRHHRLLELFLTKTLGVPWDEVHADAERLEHVISEE